MPVLQVIFLLRSGTPIYSKKLSEELTNEELISPFISAIISFAEASFSQSELSNIMIGNNLLTVAQGFLEDSEDILGIMVSTGIDDTTAHAILLDIMEKFLIGLDQAIRSGNVSLDRLKKGKTEDFSFMDNDIAEIISWQQEKKFQNYLLSVSIPRETVEKINSLLERDRNMGEIYQFKESALIEQMITEYIYYDFEEKLKDKFDIL